MPTLSAQSPAPSEAAPLSYWAADGISAKEKRAELARIVGSTDFPETPRKRNLLSYLVEYALTKESDRTRLSAREIAVQVLGRQQSFDAIRDPIVRIEVAKLRRDLETYYLKTGRRNPLRIEIPRGGYDPVFMRHSRQKETAVGETPALTGDRAADVSAELQRVVRSNDFPATPRNRRFLSYVVEKELAGEGDDIKSKAIAIHAFGRDASFDPNVDPIVRIEAGRLRRDLEIYYLKSGRFNPLRITIPKGRYVPVFVRPSTQEAV